MFGAGVDGQVINIVAKKVAVNAEKLIAHIALTKPNH